MGQDYKAPNVTETKFLGAVLNSDGDALKAPRRRLNKAKGVFREPLLLFMCSEVPIKERFQEHVDGASNTSATRAWARSPLNAIHHEVNWLLHRIAGLRRRQ